MLTIRSKLISAFLTIALLPVLIVAFITSQNVIKQAKANFIQTSSADIAIVDQSFSNFFDVLSYNVSFLADTTILLIVWMAAGFLFGSYLAAGSAKTAYGGVQFCIGMTMTFGTQALPLSPPDETFGRLVGALIGFLISFLVAHFIWPQQPRQQFRNSAANILIEARGFLLTLIKFNHEEVDVIEKQFYQVSHSLRSNLILINDYSHTFYKSAMIEEYMHQVNLSCSRLSLQVITVYDVFKNIKTLQGKKRYVQIFVDHEEVLFNLIEEVSEMVSDVEKKSQIK